MRKYAFVLFLIVSSLTEVQARVTLPALISDGMVLQQDTKINMWGSSYSITIDDGEPVTLNDVMIGEVWVCSGQSNMEFRMQGSMNQPMPESFEEIFLASSYPQVRQFDVKVKASLTRWHCAMPSTIGARRPI